MFHVAHRELGGFSCMLHAFCMHGCYMHVECMFPACHCTYVACMLHNILLHACYTPTTCMIHSDYMHVALKSHACNMHVTCMLQMNAASVVSQNDFTRCERYTHNQVLRVLVHVLQCVEVSKAPMGV